MEREHVFEPDERTPLVLALCDSHKFARQTAVCGKTSVLIGKHYNTAMAETHVSTRSQACGPLGMVHSWARTSSLQYVQKEAKEFVILWIDIKVLRQFLSLRPFWEIYNFQGLSPQLSALSSIMFQGLTPELRRSKARWRTMRLCRL